MINRTIEIEDLDKELSITVKINFSGDWEEHFEHEGKIEYQPKFNEILRVVDISDNPKHSHSILEIADEHYEIANKYLENHDVMEELNH